MRCVDAYRWLASPQPTRSGSRVQTPSHARAHDRYVMAMELVTAALEPATATQLPDGLRRTCERLARQTQAHARSSNVRAEVSTQAAAVQAAAQLLAAGLGSPRHLPPAGGSVRCAASQGLDLRRGWLHTLDFNATSEAMRVLLPPGRLMPAEGLPLVRRPPFRLSLWPHEPVARCVSAMTT